MYVHSHKANPRDLIAATGYSVVQIDFSVLVTLQLDRWAKTIIWHLLYATSIFVHHFVTIWKFKQSGNAQFGSKSSIFQRFFSSFDLEISWMTSKNSRANLLCRFQLCTQFLIIVCAPLFFEYKLYLLWLIWHFWIGVNMNTCIWICSNVVIYYNYHCIDRAIWKSNLQMNMVYYYFHHLAQYCSNPIANALESPPYCT